MASINTQRPPSGIGTFVLGILLLGVFAALVVSWIKTSAPKADLVETERATARNKKREELEKDWTSKLQTVAWVDKDKAVVQVPIEDAMRVVAAELKSKQVVKTEVKVPPPLPLPVIDPKATEPPPPALTSAPQGADLIQFGVTVAPADPATPPTLGTPPPPVPPSTPPSAQGLPPPLPAIPPPVPDAAPALTVSGTPARPPLINWSESK